MGSRTKKKMQARCGVQEESGSASQEAASNANPDHTQCTASPLCTAEWADEIRKVGPALDNPVFFFCLSTGTFDHFILQQPSNWSTYFVMVSGAIRLLNSSSAAYGQYVFMFVDVCAHLKTGVHILHFLKINWIFKPPFSEKQGSGQCTPIRVNQT